MFPQYAGTEKTNPAGSSHSGASIIALLALRRHHILLTSCRESLRKGLKHLGAQPGEKIIVDKLPDGRIEIKASRPKGKISDVFDFLKQENGPSLSIEQINEVARRGWAGRR